MKKLALFGIGLAVIALKWNYAAAAETIQGCLSGPTSEGVYLLKNAEHKKGLEVGGSDDLSKHVGHEVKLTGDWASAADIGEKEKGEAKEEKGEAE